MTSMQKELVDYTSQIVFITSVIMPGDLVGEISSSYGAKPLSTLTESIANFISTLLTPFLSSYELLSV